MSDFFFKPLELCVIEFDESYPNKLHKCIIKFYNIENTSIRFYFPYIEYFSQ